jgi:CRP-like cAMP-binding protein
MDASDLKSVPLFAGLGKHDRELVARFVDEVDVPSGQVLTTEGGPSDEFFVIRSGSAKVIKHGTEVNRLGAGDFFGEIGVLRGGRRTATVVAETPMSLLVMFGQNFSALDHEIEAIRVVVEKAMAERLDPDPAPPET